MKAKTIVSTVLLLFVAASVAYLVVNESRSQPEADQGVQTAGAAPTTAQQAVAESAVIADQTTDTGHKLIAYYFHRTQRCRTCLAMEAYAEEALREAFPEAMEAGELEWHAVNTEELANEHFVQDYEITSSSLVMIYFENGEQKEWKNLDEVWDLVGDKQEFQAYVETEALAYLEKGS